MDKTDPQRLCDRCVCGVVVQGQSRQDPADVREEVICLFMGRVMDIDVTGCNRFSERPLPFSFVTAPAVTAWVA